ncbi:MAG TPA: hypothetical protein ENL09_06280 [Bacteroidetes bacterium]|nr:hypothetical protein [Bacteroidota bacterium]
MSYVGKDGEVRENYVVCPVCGWNWVEKVWLNRFRRNNPVDENDVIIQVRKIRGGKKPDGVPYRKRPGGGFEVVEDECIPFKELPNSEDHSEVLEDIKNQTINMVKLLISLGVLSLDDLK